ncbi:hypothetical protein ACFIJ5_17890 (plasmid) [Haloimpatiens sp. FM7330]|uniref:hypothetical protein n=1 Tax=Haloimpatiens sp. FM7330 TaxID=3298610 RepID=UPI00362E51B1
MKTNNIFIVFIGVFLVLMVGCSNVIKNEGNKIVVEKIVGENDKYEYFNEISDSKEVKNVRDILYSISWENVKVNMTRHADYKFHFENSKEKHKSNGLIYDLWISPNKDKIELVIESESKYVQLNEEKSKELFEIITGKKLNED